MLKKVLSILLVVACLLPLSACSSANKYELAFNFDENGKKEMWAIIDALFSDKLKESVNNQ